MDDGASSAEAIGLFILASVLAELVSRGILEEASIASIASRADAMISIALPEQRQAEAAQLVGLFASFLRAELLPRRPRSDASD